jgi:hypothetical protein
MSRHVYEISLRRRGEVQLAKSLFGRPCSPAMMISQPGRCTQAAVSRAWILWTLFDPSVNASILRSVACIRHPPLVFLQDWHGLLRKLLEPFPNSRTIVPYNQRSLGRILLPATNPPLACAPQPIKARSSSVLRRCCSLGVSSLPLPAFLSLSSRREPSRVEKVAEEALTAGCSAISFLLPWAYAGMVASVKQELFSGRLAGLDRCIALHGSSLCVACSQ